MDLNKKVVLVNINKPNITARNITTIVLGLVHV